MMITTVCTQYAQVNKTTSLISAETFGGLNGLSTLLLFPTKILTVFEAAKPARES